MKGKIAVITGSSKGIGMAVALAFAKSKNYSGIITNARYYNEAERLEAWDVIAFPFKQMSQKKQIV